MKRIKIAAVLATVAFLMAGMTCATFAQEGTAQGGIAHAASPSSSEDTLGMPVSYGLRVLAARDEIVFSGICGNEISFVPEDICRAMNLSSLSYITLTSLPAPKDGTLFVGAAGAAIGQSIPVEAMSLLSFSAARMDAPCETTMSFTVNGGGYEINCRLCLLDRINYTPTVALAPELSLEVLTYCDIPVMGSLSSYDPEGDEVTYEITGYASHGRVVLNQVHTGCYTYTPDRGYVGKDSFTYVVRDSYGNYSTAATVTVQVSSVPSTITYADLDQEACAAAAISITSAGYMNGVRVGRDDFFRPSDSMSRVEFLVTAMNVAGVRPDGNTSVASESWYDGGSVPEAMRPYVALALERGYLTSKTNDKGQIVIAPQETITRAEAAVILSNIIGYANQTTVSAFADSDDMPAWAVPALTSLRALGLLTSPDDTARAKDTMTRGESAIWFSRTLQLMKR